MLEDIIYVGKKVIFGAGLVFLTSCGEDKKESNTMTPHATPNSILDRSYSPLPSKMISPTPSPTPSFPTPEISILPTSEVSGPLFNWMEETDQCFDLRQYADCFVSNEGKYTGYFVIPTQNNPNSGNNLALIDVIGSMKYTNENGRLVQVDTEGTAIRDFEVHPNNAYTSNYIAAGQPCENRITGVVLGTNECQFRVNEDEARIELVAHENGNSTMMFWGYNVEMTMLAAKVIAHRWDDVKSLMEERVNSLKISNATSRYDYSLAVLEVDN
jgi:hypothetical protein